MPIIDPLYTLLLAAGLLLAWRLGPAHAARTALITLVLSSAYLGYGAYLNRAAEHEAARQLAAEGLRPQRLAAFPTILQVHYRRVVARLDDEDRVGFVSMWRPCPIDWHTAPRNHEDAAPVADFLSTREGRIFHWFTMGWARYRLEAAAGALAVVATDLRYGFTADPNRSIFNARAPVDSRSGGVGAVRAGRDAGDASGRRLALLYQDTYAPVCEENAAGELARAGSK